MSEENAAIDDGGSNLVDQMQQQANENQQQQKEQEAGANDSEWFWQDEMKGEGDKPDWFIDSKYKTIAEQAKGYNEIRQQLGTFTGAPEEYDIQLPEDLELPDGVEWELEPDDPLATAMAGIAKDLNMSQDGFNQLIKGYVQHEAGLIAAEQQEEMENAQTELASIPDGVQRVGTVSAWAKANLADAEYEAFKTMLTSADALQMAETLIGKTRNSKVPDGSETFAGAVTQEDIDAAFQEKDENGKNKYATDPQHRAKVQRMMQNFHGTS